MRREGKIKIQTRDSYTVRSVHKIACESRLPYRENERKGNTDRDVKYERMSGSATKNRNELGEQFRHEKEEPVSSIGRIRKPLTSILSHRESEISYQFRRSANTLTVSPLYNRALEGPLTRSSGIGHKI